MLSSTTLFPFKPYINPSQKSFARKPTNSSFTITSPTAYLPNKITDEKYVRVLDTTLRDGEQAPGATMVGHQKLALAHQLASLGVDVIEAGFPVSSRAEFETMQIIAKEVGNCTDASGRVPVVSAVSRMVQRDIDTTWEAVRYAKHPRLNVFIPTSEIHLKYKLNKTKEEVLRIVEEMVSYTRSLGVMDIGFISEDSARSEKEFLYQVFGEAIKAGATTITFCDTVGCKLPNEWGQFIADMKANIVGVENAINAGARQVEVTINGIGERAGNAPLEEVVMALKYRGEDLLGGLYTGINTKHIVMASNMVEKYSGLSIQPHKPIVGANAFVHGSGIHQDGVLKHRATYEFISPEEIGLSRSTGYNGIVLGKLSGRHAVKSRLLELGYEFDEKKFEEIFFHFKAIADKKKVSELIGARLK
ncbi:hypothetical protein LguiB_032584 [Lonicera macranthoides]